MTSNARLPREAEQVLSPAAVNAGYDHLAHQLQPLVEQGDALLLGVLNGGLVPLVRLLDRLDGDYRIDYCHPRRYGDATRGTALRWLRRPDSGVQGHRVIVVDDIFDEGLTLAAVVAACHAAGAREVHSAVGFIKANPRRPVGSAPDFSTGLEVPDRFVFGCGMDIAGRWRQLDGVYAMPEDVQ